MTHSEGSLADVFGRQTVVKIAIGFAIAAVLLGILATAIGWRAAVAELRSADPAFVALGCLSTALGLMAWGKAWQVVLRVGDIQAPYRKLVVTYFAATFANYVTPLGQAGGEPLGVEHRDRAGFLAGAQGGGEVVGAGGGGDDGAGRVADGVDHDVQPFAGPWWADQQDGVLDGGPHLAASCGAEQVAHIGRARIGERGA